MVLWSPSTEQARLLTLLEFENRLRWFHPLSLIIHFTCAGLMWNEHCLPSGAVHLYCQRDGHGPQSTARPNGDHSSLWLCCRREDSHRRGESARSSIKLQSLLSRRTPIPTHTHIHTHTQRYLIPQAQEGSGVTSDQLTIASDAIGSLIKWYCRESGVRNLQKHIEKVTVESCYLLARGSFRQIPEGGRKHVRRHFGGTCV